jgi:hypothetical protein
MSGKIKLLNGKGLQEEIIHDQLFEKYGYNEAERIEEMVNDKLWHTVNRQTRHVPFINNFVREKFNS